MFLRRQKRPFKEHVRNIVSPPSGYKRAAHYILLRLKRRPGTPEYIAKGFAIGIAVNYWPVLGTHLIVGYLFCLFLRGDLIAMFIGTLFGNPWTFAIVYPLSYKLGKTLLGLRPNHRLERITTVTDVWHQIWPIKSMESFWYAFHELLWPMILGGFLLALPSAIFGYYVAKNAIHVYQIQRRKSLTKKFETDAHDIDDPVRPQ